MRGSSVTDLTLDRLLELERLQQEAHAVLSEPGPLSQRGFGAQAAWTTAVLGSRHELLAAARELASLKHALEFLNYAGAIVSIGDVERDMKPGDVLATAKEFGWSPPNGATK